VAFGDFIRQRAFQDPHPDQFCPVTPYIVHNSPALAFVGQSWHSDVVTIEFDFRFHPDRSKCTGTQYFEFLPGPYMGAHWVPGARFIDEYTFCLFEGIFERRVPDYDHFGFLNIGGLQWDPILADLTNLRLALTKADWNEVEMPFGSTLRIEEAFRIELPNNQRGLIALLSEMDDWIRGTLRDHGSISLLGL
jgi:hypothetical protein